jgi:hypothetical protein
MAILSNINGKFAVDSTGAIQLSGSAGTANYVLVSGGAAAAPTWVAASTVIGGPYLPLSGGTLTGATATATGISFTVGGALTGVGATFTGNVAAATFNSLAINTTGTNNLANQIVRTDVNGYANFGWINTISGASNGTITRIYASQDAYVRYMTPASFRTQITDPYYAPTGTVSGVTSVATGNGLTGGTITSTGTLTMSGSYTGNFVATTLIGPLSDSGYKTITNPGGATYVTSASSLTGAIVITLPIWSYPMVRMTIQIYEYTTNESFTVSCGGHTSGISWHNPFAYIVSNPGISRNFTVRFGRNAAGLPVIYIGELASTWSYPQVFVTDFQNGYSGNSNGWTSGWSVGFRTGSFEGITQTISNSQVGYNGTTQLTNYLPLSGGTMTGSISMGTQNFAVAANYGRGVFGLYASTIYQHLWSMGTAYKLPDDGSTTGNLYGVAWSHPNAGGAAANLSDHGMLLINNGVYRAAISNSIRCVTDMRTPIYYDSDNTAYYGDFSSYTYGKYYGRIAHNEGFQVGGYNNVGSNHATSNPIYTIGSSYMPAVTTLSNMYGVGYTGVGSTFINFTGQSDWGFYVAADGDARVWLDGSSGNISTAGNTYAASYYDYNNTGYYLDPANTSNLNAILFNGGTLSGTLTMNTQKALVANNYGRGVYGLYSSTKFQHVWSMGTAYNLSDDGSTTGNLYGLCWSYPSAGGAAANLNTHGLMVINNGGWDASLASSTRAGSDMRTPVYYDLNNTAYYGDFASESRMAAIRIGGSGYGLLSADNSRNLKFQGYSSTDGGFTGYGSTGVHLWQLYGAGTNYGFLNANWAAWDLRKEKNGNLYLNNQSTYYLNPSSISIFNDARANIYYDQANTAYYTRPASSSYINTLQTAGQIQVGASGSSLLYIGGTSGNYFRFHTNNADTYFDMNCGNLYWRQGSSTRFYFYTTTANMTINGSLTQNSDIRVKENIVEISDCIGKIQAIRGVYYNRTDFNTDITKIGVIAQEVEEVLPELILEAPDTGLKSVAYAELTAVLINAVKEQQVIIDDLKLRIEKLEL